MQRFCPICQQLKATAHWHGKQCRDCYNQQHPPHPSCAATATPALAVSPKPPPLFPLPRLKHLSTVERAAVVVLHKQGETRQQIGQQLAVSQPTVRHWIQHYEQTGDVKDVPRSGRPRCTDEALDTAIVGASHLDPFAAPRQLKRKLELEDVSARTIDRRLIEAGLPGRVARHVFQLTDDHKRKRLSFAHGYERWSEADWLHVLFADVKTFTGQGSHGQVWVRRPVGEAGNEQYSVAHKPHPVAVPAWGCFSAHGPGYMAMFDGSLDAAGLRDIFRDYLLPTVAEHFGESADWWLLHDNDPGRHKSQVLRAFMHNHYIRPLEFPPYSPDLNPIENVWADMDKRMASKPAESKEVLEKQVAEVWAATTQEYCSKLARSMPKRIAQVIERNGAYTDY